MQPILDRYRAKVLLDGRTRRVYLGNCTQEYCGMIAYNSLEDLRRLSHDPDFLEIRSLRDGATENYVLTTIEDFETLDHAVEYLEGGGS